MHRHESEVERYLLSCSDRSRESVEFRVFHSPLRTTASFAVNHSFPSLATSRIIQREPGEKLRYRPILGFRFFEAVNTRAADIIEPAERAPESVRNRSRNRVAFSTERARRSVSRVSRLSHYRSIVHPVRYHSQCARVARQVDPPSNLIVEQLRFNLIARPANARER